LFQRFDEWMRRFASCISIERGVKPQEQTIIQMRQTKPEISYENVHQASVSPARADSRSGLDNGQPGDGADLYDPV
jgi:hypothetical protein